MFETYEIPPHVATLQAVSFPVWPSTYNAIVFLVLIVIILLCVDTLTTTIYVAQVIKTLRSRSVGVLEGFSIYTSDIKQLTRNHLARVLKSGSPSDGSQLPSVYLNAYALPPTVQLIRRVISTQPTGSDVIPTEAIVGFSLCSNTSCMLHLFGRVSPTRVSQLLKHITAIEEHALPSTRSAIFHLNRIASWIVAMSRYLVQFAAVPVDSVRSVAEQEESLPVTMPWLTSNTSALYKLVFDSLAKDCPRVCHTSVSLPSTFGETQPMEVTLGLFFGNDFDQQCLTPIVVLVETELDDRSTEDGTHANQLLVISVGVQEVFIQSGTLTQFTPFWKPWGRQLLEHQDVYGIDDSNERECLICLNALKNAILLPCR
eukprot:Gregarina_sp_Poly_1__4792@NODE_2554_length_1989_cov_37_433403_g1622_i0_p1_GENE_NODE_2554_length_1989_cov_37_433403_g1622_i0NODE_2554_length_1989_cov_37_433403_g1622_i0_p1_ORF_typecomplete_len372_score40_31zfC3HC4_3/PF13920_6/1_1e04zfC3HC4_3/PF13920_6/0_019DUF273/PF03314_14/0_22_NODE_2554_length_1989_cov_37_433403_g1622_i0291144